MCIIVYTLLNVLLRKGQRGIRKMKIEALVLKVLQRRQNVVHVRYICRQRQDIYLCEGGGGILPPPPPPKKRVKKSTWVDLSLLDLIIILACCFFSLHFSLSLSSLVPVDWA